MAAEKTQEDVRTKWLKIRSSVRWANQELREAQERLRVIGQGNPWLATIDGILRNLDGSYFYIPKGPKVVRVPRRTEEPEVSPQQEGQPLSRSVDKEKPKKRTAPPPRLRNQGRRPRPGKESCKSPLPPRRIHLADTSEAPVSSQVAALARKWQ
jgi:hypothetical protein